MLEHYVTQALRSFWRFKVTAAVNVVGLALALVCFVATYLYLDSLLSSDSHFKNASRTYALTQELWTSPTDRMIPAFPQVAPAAAKHLRADLPGLEAVARALGMGPVAVATDDRKATVFAAAVDPEFLKIFDLSFVSGDTQTPLASAHSIIMTEDAATRLFGTTANVIGRSILINGRAKVIVTAVIADLPRDSHMGDADGTFLRFGLLMPMNLFREFINAAGPNMFGDPDSDRATWGNDSYFTYVLLPSNGAVTLQQLEANLESFGDRHVPKDQILSVFGAVPLGHVKLQMLEAMMGNRAISATTSVFLLDTLILIIACLNYANLAVAIATTRAREIGMRKVLGASRLHLMRQYLVEAALLGAAALVIVLVGVTLAVPALNQSLGLNLELSSLLHPRLWVLVLALLGVISLVGAAYPALVLSRVRPVESLRAGAVRAGPKFVPTVLVGVQFAAASFLLVITLLMSVQNQVLKRAGIRPDRDPVVVLANDIRAADVGIDTLRNELLRGPGVRAVSALPSLPWQSGGWHETMKRTQDSPVQVAMFNQVSYDFLGALGMRLLAGRTLDREHGDEFSVMAPPLANGPRAVPRILIDRTLARQLGWPNPADAVGKEIFQSLPGAATQPGRPRHVVGVVEDGYPRLVGPNANSNIYMLSPTDAGVPIVRVSRDNIQAALAHIDEVWERLAPKIPLRRFFMDELFNTSYENFTTISRVLGGLSIFAFVIAVMGLFGMALHVTSRRLREIGIRKTLGASARGVVLMLLRDFSKPVVIANIIVWPFAFVAGRLYLDMFMHRAPLSPWPFVISLGITLAIAWLAVAAQALRAAAVKPAQVLHLE